MFEKLEEGVTSLFNSIASGTADLSEKISLKSKIEDAKKEIAKTYSEIGEQLYTEKKDEVPMGYEEKFEKIRAAFESIEEYTNQLKKMAGIRKCPSCGGDVAKNSRYCVKCGTFMPEEEKKPEDKTVCPSCGAEAEPGAIFCVTCGAKLTPPEPKKEAPKCPRCGAKIVAGACFCSICGEKLPELPEEEEEAPVPETEEDVTVTEEAVAEAVKEPAATEAEEE